MTRAPGLAPGTALVGLRLSFLSLASCPAWGAVFGFRRERGQNFNCAWWWEKKTWIPADLIMLLVTCVSQCRHCPAMAAAADGGGAARRLDCKDGTSVGERE